MDESSVVNAMSNSNNSSVSTNRSPDTQGKCDRHEKTGLMYTKYITSYYSTYLLYCLRY